MKRYQYTVKKPISCCGIGLHSGKPINLTILPAEENTGVKFIRSDLGRKAMVPAYMNRVVNTMLATTIAEDDVKVATTEHLMAALSGMGIDNAVVEIDEAEIPIMDGSAGPFVRLLKKAGSQRQKATKKLLKITKELTFGEGEKKIRILPYNGFKITCEIDFPHNLIKKQTYSVNISPRRFAEEIASARTFGFINEVEKLRENGLALGGSLDNAIVIDDYGVLNEEGLRYADEFVRHKILDLIGDLALLGCHMHGHVIAYKSGHEQHLKLMQEIAANPECWDYVSVEAKGEAKILEKVVSTTKAAGNMILPFLVPPKNTGMTHCPV
jgi:UDP-3-O-[3-hydroxymyristoyl] N-acetylglucosamine deacetylase